MGTISYLKIKDKIEAMFGQCSLGHALFYNHAGGLRFELSESGSYIHQFTTALNKSQKILDSALQDSKELYVCLTYYGGPSFVENLSLFRNLKDCQISIPRKKYEVWQSYDAEAELDRVYLAYPVEIFDVYKYLWGALAGELGVRPRLNCGVYFVDCKSRLIAHPYDDRGMDVIGPNTNLLKELYDTYHSYLLEYDLEEMKRHYE